MKACATCYIFLCWASHIISQTFLKTKPCNLTYLCWAHHNRHNTTRWNFLSLKAGSRNTSVTLICVVLSEFSFLPILLHILSDALLSLLSVIKWPYFGKDTKYPTEELELWLCVLPVYFLNVDRPDSIFKDFF